MEDLNPLNFELFDNKYVPELNSWSEKESAAGRTGLEDFVVSKGTQLGDYVAFVSEEMPDVTSYLAFHEKDLVGFMCLTVPEQDHMHIEIMGVNPDCRGQGVATKMLCNFKSKMLAETSATQLTLEVNKKNIAGIKSFSKVATKDKEQTKDDYISFHV